MVDLIKTELLIHLETLCRKWGNNDEIGFEDDKCAWNRRQLVDKSKILLKRTQDK